MLQPCVRHRPPPPPLDSCASLSRPPPYDTTTAAQEKGTVRTSQPIRCLPLSNVDRLVFGLASLLRPTSSPPTRPIAKQTRCCCACCDQEHGPNVAPPRVGIVTGRDRRDSLHDSATWCRLLSFSLHDWQKAKQQSGVRQAENEDDDGECLLVILKKRPADCWRQQVLSRK